MNQQQFEARYGESWQRLEALLDQLDKPRWRIRKATIDGDAELPQLYRQICHHYALARQRHYSPHLMNRLHHLVWRGHMQLYRRSSIWWTYCLAFIGHEFPQLVRRHRRLLLLACTAFLLPGVLFALFCYQDGGLIYSFMEMEQVAQLEEMYDPQNRQLGRGEARRADSDMMMFGFYILNNIGIGFRTFAGGLLYGIGTAFFLVFNGLHLGAAAGHLTRLGYGSTFWQFVCGHGAFELTAIVISGMAGFRLAHPLFAPGQSSRINALKPAALESLKLMIGAALMFLIAAFIEAFWSSSTLVTPALKYSVAALLWLAVISYLIFAGRDDGY